MYYKNEIVRYLQANNILALKLEHAVAGAEKAVANQIESVRFIIRPVLPMSTKMCACNKKPKTYDLKTV